MGNTQVVVKTGEKSKNNQYWRTNMYNDLNLAVGSMGMS